MEFTLLHLLLSLLLQAICGIDSKMLIKVLQRPDNLFLPKLPVQSTCFALESLYYRVNAGSKIISPNYQLNNSVLQLSILVGSEVRRRLDMISMQSDLLYIKYAGNNSRPRLRTAMHANEY